MAERERDEAREAARELLALLQSSAADHDHDELLFQRWPWLREKEESPGAGVEVRKKEDSVS